MGQMGNRPLKPPKASDLEYLSLMNKNEIGMEVIKVYAVIGGNDYEGENFDSLKIFMLESWALDYKIELEKELYDYVSIEVREVNV
jgi:hypothetical protein